MLARYVGRAENKEISEIIKRDFNVGSWTRNKECTVTVLKISYWNLDYRIDTDILIK